CSGGWPEGFDGYRRAQGVPVRGLHARHDARRAVQRGARDRAAPQELRSPPLLVENAGRLISKDEIIRAVWSNVVVSDESLTRCTRDVRAALADERQRIIKTVPRRGYIFDVPVLETGMPGAAAAGVASVETSAPAGQASGGARKSWRRSAAAGAF